METIKMGTTKKSATKIHKQFLGAATKRMTKRSLQNKLKKKVIAAMASKPEPTIPPMFTPQLAEVMSHLKPRLAAVMSELPGETLYDPNKSLSAAMEALTTAADELRVDVLTCSLKLVRHPDRTALMVTVVDWIYRVVKMLNNTPFGDEEFHAILGGLALAGTKAGSANDGTDSDETANEAPQSMTADNGMDNALQSNEAPAAHDNATSECNLMDGNNHRTKRRKIILRVGSKNSHAAI